MLTVTLKIFFDSNCENVHRYKNGFQVMTFKIPLPSLFTLRHYFYLSRAEFSTGCLNFW